MSDKYLYRQDDEEPQPERRRTGLSDADRTAVAEQVVGMIKSTISPLSDEERTWVRMAIKADAERQLFRKAVIEKSLGGLVWAGLVGFGYFFLDWAKAHGFKP